MSVRVAYIFSMLVSWWTDFKSVVLLLAQWRKHEKSLCPSSRPQIGCLALSSMEKTQKNSFPSSCLRARAPKTFLRATREMVVHSCSRCFPIALTAATLPLHKVATNCFDIPGPSPMRGVVFTDTENNVPTKAADAFCFHDMRL